MTMPQLLAGVDEAGRGPLAGPVIAAAVILPSPLEGARDSKKLTALQRQRLAERIKIHALTYAYGRAEVHEIDQLNIHVATLLAMQRAVEGLSLKPTLVWIDGLFAPQLPYPTCTLVKGDSLINEISCASILAKVYRDEEMIQLSVDYPHYGFEKHKGYGTALHLAAIKQHGLSQIHRRSFKITLP